MIPAVKSPVSEIAIRDRAANDGPTPAGSQVASSPSTLKPRAALGSETRLIGGRHSTPIPPPPSDDVDVVPPGWVVDSPFVARNEALLAVLTPGEAARAGADLGPSETAWRVHLFRDRFGLFSLNDMSVWLDRAGLPFPRFTSYVATLALVERLEQAHRARLDDETELYNALMTARTWVELHRGRPTAVAADAELDALLGVGIGDRLRDRAMLLRLIAAREMSHLGTSLRKSDVDRMTERFCARFGLNGAADLDAWLPSAGIPGPLFTRIMEGLVAVLELAEREAEPVAAALAMDAAARTATG
jgi:hypothetical protein